MENDATPSKYNVRPDALALLPDDRDETEEVLDEVWGRVTETGGKPCFFTLQMCGKLLLSSEGVAPVNPGRWLVMDGGRNVSLAGE